jgi:hypothetical protein
LVKHLSQALRRWGRQIANGLEGVSNDPESAMSPFAAFTTERNVDAQCPQEHLRATQAASEAGVP